MSPGVVLKAYGPKQVQLFPRLARCRAVRVTMPTDGPRLRMKRNGFSIVGTPSST